MPVQQDRFDVGRLRSPAYDAVAVTPSDTVDLPRGVCKGLYIGGAGNVQVTTEGGQGLAGPPVVVFTAPPVGSVLPVRVSRVWAANTSATLLVALY